MVRVVILCDANGETMVLMVIANVAVNTDHHMLVVVVVRIPLLLG